MIDFIIFKTITPYMFNIARRAKGLYQTSKENSNSEFRLGYIVGPSGSKVATLNDSSFLRDTFARYKIPIGGGRFIYKTHFTISTITV